jgi:hypothetical protein
LLKKWPERIKLIKSAIVFLAARELSKTVLDGIPTGSAYKIYRKSFRVSRLIGEPGIFAVHCQAASHNVKKLPADQTVLFIKPLERSTVPNEPMKVLEKYSPWTLNTLPIMPDRRQAVLTYRKVARAQVNKIAESNKKKEVLWRKELADAGIRGVRKKHGQGENLFDSARGVPDLAFDAFRLEFGLGGIRAKPHWRPAIRKLVQSGLSSISSKKEIVEALTKQEFGALRRLQKTPYIVRVTDAQNFRTFQEKLGLSGGPFK